MFRKLVSNLAFSPALVGQLGFYAKRLRKEESVRRLGLIFTAFALVVQFFAVFQAPEPATAADATDMVYGGVWSKQALLSTYDSNVNNIRDLYDTVGISRSDIDQAGNNLEYHRSNEGLYSWGMKPVIGSFQSFVGHSNFVNNLIGRLGGSCRSVGVALRGVLGGFCLNDIFFTLSIFYPQSCVAWAWLTVRVCGKQSRILRTLSWLYNLKFFGAAITGTVA